MMQNDEIVFEDLHGVTEDEPVTVDMDAASKDDGITRTPADQAAGDDGADDDGIEFSGLRDADASRDADSDDDASKGGEDDEYSKKVRARIQRATRSEKAAKQEADYWKQQAESLAARQTSLSKETLERNVEQADAKIEQTLQALEQAVELGNTKDQVKLTAELTDFKAEKIQSELELQNLPESGNLQPFSGKVESESTEQSLADKWMNERSDWYGARGFDRQTRLANRIDREVMQEGYDPNSAEYFEELDARLAEKLPDLYTDADDGNTQDRRRPKRSPVAPVGGADGSRQRSSSSKVELGKEDFANMRRFGLDPNNPEVLKEYARSKRESQGAR